MKKLLSGINKVIKEKKIDCPIALKISPDINDSEISRIVDLVSSHKIQGLVVSNTTDSNRDNLSDIKKHETGGLSGQPLKDISTNLIKKFFKETKGKIKIIGVGGVDSGKSAFEKIIAGADAIQLYTGMVYKGPGVVKEIKKELISILKKENLKNISEAVGINA
jgi:dihydroorotate dehydrogenase